MTQDIVGAQGRPSEDVACGSFHVYSTQSDVDLALNALDGAIQH